MHRKLTYSQREQIENLHKQGISQAAIARAIGVHRSTVKRELDRNSKKEEYTAFDAHVSSLLRKKLAGKWVYFIKRFRKERVYHPLIFRRLFRIRNISPLRYFKDSERNMRPPKMYDYRKNFRREKDHPHFRRSTGSKVWKRCYEWLYRLRDYKREESQRMKRFYWHWQNYNYSPFPRLMRKFSMGRRHKSEAQKRLHYIQLLEEMKQDMNGLDELLQRLIPEKAPRIVREQPLVQPMLFFIVARRPLQGFTGSLCVLPRPDS